MDPCIIQDILGIWNTKETCSLFEGLSTKTWDLFDFSTWCNLTILLTVGDDIFRDGLVESWHVWQEGTTCRIDINTNLVNHGIDDEIKIFREFLLTNIMLVLAYSDWFRVNLNQLSQWVLKTTGNGNGRAFFDRQVWELMSSQLWCRVDRGTTFIDNNIRSLWKILEDFCHKSFTFTTGCSITNSDNLNGMLFNEVSQVFLSLGNLGLTGWSHWIDNLRCNELTSLVNYGQLSPCTKGWVKTEYHLTFKWWN